MVFLFSLKRDTGHYVYERPSHNDYNSHNDKDALDDHVCKDPHQRNGHASKSKESVHY